MSRAGDPPVIKVVSRRIVVEEPCEHGEMEDHYICDEWDNVKWAAHTKDESCLCPGGSRTVLEGIPDEWVQRAAKVLIEDKFKLRDEGMPIPNLVALNVLEAAVFGGTPNER